MLLKMDTKPAGRRRASDLTGCLSLCLTGRLFSDGCGLDAAAADADEDDAASQEATTRRPLCPSPTHPRESGLALALAPRRGSQRRPVTGELGRA